MTSKAQPYKEVFQDFIDYLTIHPNDLYLQNIELLQKILLDEKVMNDKLVIRTDLTQDQQEKKAVGQRIRLHFNQGCRIMAKCFTDGQEIRHKISNENDINIVIAVFNKSDNILVGVSNTIKGEKYENMNQFASNHYKAVRPDRTQSVNAWKECECLIDDKWGSTYRLAAI